MGEMGKGQRQGGEETQTMFEKGKRGGRRERGNGERGERRRERGGRF